MAKMHTCVLCAWVYDPADGDPDGGVAQGTLWEDLPAFWVCPQCGAGKEHFEEAG